ncbi:nucleotide-sugar transporter-domain-containing protein [Kickxella alabastrina]|uniref:nucleotide-sugar transporter-domain-containing protein n=1 Tax=Kickxella alabastrina TaxID=61397 RepID=UPI00221E6FD8|nr:nucleotide-sugar transporter-domain-containing protein [Kickxella alabastrina]KAI7820719.1 nucleotide-sugar transporter-domain-containing protein [Kickxella alabastrina]
MAPQVFGIPLKYVSLMVLTLQNSILVLVMRYSRVISTTERYYTSTAVLLSELTNGSEFKAKHLVYEVFGGDSWKMLIPAGLYTIQNNLQYVAVTYQLKILTTALCSVVLLRTVLGRARWLALVGLTAGVALVQMPTATGDQKEETTSSIVGLLAVLAACVLSGLAGVYFEKVLKGSRKSLWTRNVQLSLFSTLPALFGVFVVDGAGVSRDGFFHAYSSWTWGAIMCQAVGGLIVAVVVKYADNILKGFATSISIVLSCLASVWIFGFHITLPFVLGTALVIGATYLYGAAELSVASRPQQQQDALLPTMEPSRNSLDNNNINDVDSIDTIPLAKIGGGRHQE